MENPSLLEEIRFGYGPFAGQMLARGGVEPERVLAQLSEPDNAGRVWKQPDLLTRLALLRVARDKRTDMSPEKEAANLELKAINARDQQMFVGRPAVTQIGFHERLVNLWANRVTVATTTTPGHLIVPFREEAIRPHVAGRYADLLKATIWHPAMHIYLNQVGSVGPQSGIGRRKGRGLNENLAREFLELHSMGTGYDQSDVTETARLLAGMMTDAKGSRMDSRAIEPGSKTILGETYRDDDPKAEIDRFVENIAARPETAASVGFYLARHFIDDVPPPDLVDALARAYLSNDSDLMPVYRSLLEHPDARSHERRKLRSPQEFVAATLRAVGRTGQEKLPKGPKGRGMRIPAALARMGQPVYRARRPDGWPEIAPGWLTPPMMAARLDWAIDLANVVGQASDPSALALQVFGDLAEPMIFRAVAGAEQRWEGLAVLLGSPDFMRR